MVSLEGGRKYTVSRQFDLSFAVKPLDAMWYLLPVVVHAGPFAVVACRTVVVVGHPHPFPYSCYSCS